MLFSSNLISPVGMPISFLAVVIHCLILHLVAWVLRLLSAVLHLSFLVLYLVVWGCCGHFDFPYVVLRL